MTAPFGFTIATTADRDRLTKLIDFSSPVPHVDGYPEGATLFHFEERRHETPREFFDGLLKLVSNPKAAILRGSPALWVNGEPVRRIYRPSGKHGPPTIEAVLRAWVYFDFDFKSGRRPPPEIAGDIGRLIDWVIANLLPEEFRGASFFWEVGPSHGIGGRLSVRLAFALRRPVSALALKTWAEAKVPEADPSVFSPAQLLYIAAPVVVGGVDPIHDRAGVHEGLVDEVEVNIPDVQERPFNPSNPEGETYLVGAAALEAQRRVLEAVSRKREGLANRHGAMKTAACFGRGIGLSPTNLRDVVRLVGAATGKPGWEEEVDELVEFAVTLPQDPQPVPATPRPQGHFGPARAGVPLWAEAALGIVEEGGRNGTAASIAGHLLRRKVDSRLAFVLLAAWGRSFCDPPLSDRESLAVFKSIARREGVS